MVVTEWIPEELKMLAQWCGWKYLADGGKMPIGKGGGVFRSNDPSTFMTFEEAIEMDCDHIGFVITGDDEYVGIDLDDCIQAGDLLTPWAQAIVDAFKGAAYVEISPSGHGIKMLVKGMKIDGMRCLQKIEDGAVECYEKARFWTVTGEVTDDSIMVIGNGQEGIDWLYDWHLGPKEAKAPKEVTWDPPIGGRNIDLEIRCEAYAASWDQAAEGERNNVTFRNAGNLSCFEDDSGRRLSLPQVIQIVADWNSRNPIPLPEGEMVKAIESGFNSSATRPGVKPVVTETPLERFVEKFKPKAEPEPGYVEKDFGLTIEVEGKKDKRLVRFMHHGELAHRERFDVFDKRTAEIAINEYRADTGNDMPFRVIRKLVADGWEGEGAGYDEKPLEAYTARELLEGDFSVEYLIKGFLVEKQPFMLAGKDKTMKSTIAIDMAVSLATGTPFLGKYEILKQQNVMFFSAESGMATIKEKMRVCLEERGLTKDVIGDTLVVSPEVVSLAKMVDRRRTEELVKKHDSQVLMIDPTYMSMPSDDMSNVFAQGETLRDFNLFCLRLGLTLILIHHAKKTIDHFNALERADIAGAGFGEFMRQWLLINHRESLDMDTGTFKLWLTYGGSAGHNGCDCVDIYEGKYSDYLNWREWKVTFVDRRQEVKERITAVQSKKAAQEAEKMIAKVEARQKAIVEVLRLTGRPMTMRELRSTIGNARDSTTAWESLLKDKRVVTGVKTDENGIEHSGYELGDGES